MSVSVIILAAGMGTRMRSTLPKVLHKICGKEMLSYSVEEALKISEDIHIVLFFEHQRIQKHIEESFKEHLHKISFHIQNHSKYPGTGGALMQSDGQKPIPIRHQEVLILNGDMPLITAEELKSFIGLKNPIAIGVFELENPSGYGRVVIVDDKVSQIIEEKDATPAIKAIKTLNAGVYMFQKKVLETYLPQLKCANAQKEYYLTDLIDLATKDNLSITPIFVNLQNFMGVNSKIELSKAQDLMLQRLRQKAMEQGVMMHLPQTIYLEPEVVFEGECELFSGVQISGKTKIINSCIKAHSVIEESVIQDSAIGPLSHIRPGCEIIQSHIGNFVEVKSSKLKGVKSGHLSYLGDCEIKEGTNVGAGVITCNYDGKSKHKTLIGKNVFIGSDTQLIAPLVIEDNVLIGSGTTMTKNAKEGDLVISRTKQENKNGGFYRFFPAQENQKD